MMLTKMKLPLPASVRNVSRNIFLLSELMYFRVQEDTCKGQGCQFFGLFS